MPHKKGHTWKDVRKKIGQGFQIGGAAYKGVVTGKGVQPGIDKQEKFRKDELKIQAESGKTAKAKMEAKNRLIHGDEKINALQKKGKKFKDNRAEMQKLRKTNPEKYKKLKREQRKKENLAAMKAGSHTWD